MSNKHKVKRHFWNDGKLTTYDNFFESFEEALKFAEKEFSHTVKIYNVDDELVHSKQMSQPGTVPDYIRPSDTDSYA